MADDQEREPELEPEPEPVDNSHDLDMVTFFSSSTHEGEMEAMAIHGLLEANGIPSTLMGPSTIPSLEFQVLVPREYLEAAERIVKEARAAGPQGADEAERAEEAEQASGEGS